MRAQLFVLALHAFINHDGRGSRELYSAISPAKWRGIGHNLIASPKIYTPLALGGCQFRALCVGVCVLGVCVLGECMCGGVCLVCVCVGVCAW